MSPEEEIARGAEAARIVNSAVFADSLKALKDEIIANWSAASARDTDGREWLWQHYQVALKFEEHLRSIINTGKLAGQMEKERTRAEKVARFVRDALN